MSRPPRKQNHLARKAITEIARFLYTLRDCPCTLMKHEQNKKVHKVVWERERHSSPSMDNPKIRPTVVKVSICPLGLIPLNWLFPRWPGTLSACVQAVSIDLSDNFPKQCSLPSFFLNPHHISIVFIRHITGHSVCTLVVVSHWLSHGLVETWL